MIEKVAVLVVEDEALILLDIVVQLEAEGFRVYEATNADAAIELLITHLEIRLVFTDIDMPGSMDGLKLAAAVRKRWPPVKIIITSGARRPKIMEMPEGSVSFDKPYNHLAVLASVRGLLTV